MFTLDLRSRAVAVVAAFLLLNGCDSEHDSPPGTDSSRDAGAVAAAKSDAAINPDPQTPDAAQVDSARPSSPTNGQTDGSAAQTAEHDGGSGMDRQVVAAAVGHEICSHSWNVVVGTDHPTYPSSIAVDSRGDIALAVKIDTTTKVLGTTYFEPPGIAQKVLVQFLNADCTPTSSQTFAPEQGPQGEPGFRALNALKYDRDDQLTMVSSSQHTEGVFHGLSWVTDAALLTKFSRAGEVSSETKLVGAPGTVGELAATLSPIGGVLVSDYWTTFDSGSGFKADAGGLRNLLVWYGADGSFQGGKQWGNLEHGTQFDAALTSAGELWVVTRDRELQPQTLFDAMIGPETTIAKVDAKGNVAWQKKLPSIADLGVDLIAREAPDDSLAVFYPRAHPPFDANLALLTRYEGNGEPRWEVPVYGYDPPDDIQGGTYFGQLEAHAKHTALYASLPSPIEIGNTRVDSSTPAAPLLVLLDDVGAVEWVATLARTPIAIAPTESGELVLLEQGEDYSSYTIRKFAR